MAEVVRSTKKENVHTRAEPLCRGLQEEVKAGDVEDADRDQRIQKSFVEVYQV